MSLRLVIAAVGACLVLAGCGGSSDEGSSSAEKTAEPTAAQTETQTPEATKTTSASEEKAQETVCTARSDIKKEISEIKGLSPSISSVGAAKSSLEAIDNDLQKIDGARNDLSAERKKDVQSATNQLESDVKDVQGDLVSGIAGGGVEDTLRSAATKLENSFDKSFSNVGCS